MRKFALPFLVLALCTLSIGGSRAQGTPTVFINEIHYDNTGTDTGEFIEIAGPAGTNLANYQLVLYNGAGGAVYDTKTLSGSIPDQMNGFGTVVVTYAVNGIQNGTPDGVALVFNTTTLVQFLSYEGAFAGVGGAANGVTSTDIGVIEGGSGLIGESLRLVGSGNKYSDFSWAPSAPATPGAVNQGQTFTPGGGADTAPSIINTVPADGATDVNADADIVINLSEPVTASVSAFELQCSGSSIAFGQTSGANSTFRIDPNVKLPDGAPCAVTVNADEISDVDDNDPPDHLAANFSFSFTTATPTATNVVINELDADTPGSGFDLAEFVELYDGGVGNTPLQGLTVVFFNGSSDTSYAAFDLDGYTTDASGYFTIGNPGVSGVDIEFSPGDFGFLQNGADAVAIVVGNASSFPNGTGIGGANVLDAVVYDTDDADDAGLLPLLNAGQPQVNENAGGDGPNQSIGRCANGVGGARNTDTYRVAAPSPNGPNNCPPPPVESPIVISQFYGAGGNEGAVYQNDYVELFNKTDAAVDVTGWTLQYASATGSGWDFNKTPLGGPIGPGEYYLVRLASNGAIGASVPPANLSGPINMSGTDGKIALVASVDSLTGECPLGNANLRDLVGYGNANCGEGNTKAPALTATTADFRLSGGFVDTDRNADDFNAGAPSPRRTAPIVELGPFLLSADPSTNEINVPRDPTLVITFTEPVVATDPWFELTCATTGRHDSYTQTGNGTIFDITPNVNLLAGETCTITVFKDHVRDLDLDDSAPNTDTLPVDYSWSFTVASGTAPPYPSSVHLTFGNPTNAVNDLEQFNNYLMEKPEYALSYNRDAGRPNWVSWHLSSEWYGTLSRVDTFRADPQVPPDWYRVQGFDFSGSGFDRGHMVPNADRDKETSIPINQATYLMTNMLAQAPDNNQGPWASFENELRSIADAGNEIYIVAGPAGEGGSGSNGFATTIANGHVSVPASTWKVALVLPKQDGDDLLRVDCSTRTLAVIMPNIQGIRNDDWHNYLTSVDAVEALSGFDLFSNLPAGAEYCVEAGIDGHNPPADVTPPAIQWDSPVDGAVYTLNQVVTASFRCADVESGVSTCIGTVASGSPIDTASSGPKVFTVTATDTVGNASQLTVHYTVSTGPDHKRTPSIFINNIPSVAMTGGSFTPSFTYDGDGITHLRSETPAVCAVQGDRIVNFVGAGTCTLAARATPTGSVNAALGPLQSFVVMP